MKTAAYLELLYFFRLHKRYAAADMPLSTDAVGE